MSPPHKTQTHILTTAALWENHSLHWVITINCIGDNSHGMQLVLPPLARWSNPQHPCDLFIYLFIIIFTNSNNNHIIFFSILKKNFANFTTPMWPFFKNLFRFFSTWEVGQNSDETKNGSDFHHHGWVLG
jgi:hypothetical protein